jgi:hypothetical protein
MVAMDPVVAISASVRDEGGDPLTFAAVFDPLRVLAAPLSHRHRGRTRDVLTSTSD